MNRVDLKDEPLDLVAPSMALAALCRARDFATDPEDYQCYERAIDAVTQVKAMKDQRKRALADLARFDVENGLI